MTTTQIIWAIVAGIGLLSVGALLGLLAAVLCRAAACGDREIERQRNAVAERPRG
jgi:hypothetical protein